MDNDMVLDRYQDGRLSHFKREEAAKLLDMSIQRLGFLLRSGRFPGAVQVGLRKDWRIPVGEVLGFKRLKVGRKKGA